MKTSLYLANINCYSY